MKDLLIIATSDLKPEQEKPQSNTAHPQVEYVLLAQKVGADFLNYAYYQNLLMGDLLRRIETTIRSDITLSLAGLRRSTRYKTIIAMSERVGIPLAFYKRLGLLQSKLIFRFTAWSARQESLFTKYDLLSYVDHIIVESQPLGDLLHTRFGVPRSKITFVPYSIDVDYFTPSKASASTGRIKPKLFSAGEIRGRDYATLIEAVTPLTDVDVEIAASGTWFAREKDTSLDSELPPNITIAGRKPRSEMRASYADASFVVVPLYDQVFSAGITVVLEALAMGKAVITTKSKGLASYLKDGENCCLVAPENPQEMRNAITHLLNNPSLARKLGKNARKSAENQFGLDSFVGQLEGVISSVQQ